MGQLLDKVVEDGIKKKYIDTAEGERVKKAVQNVSAKFKFPEEWLVKMILVEAEGFNANRGGNCVGVVQSCQGESTLDTYINANGGYNWWRKVGPAKQIEAWGTYHLGHWVKTAGGKTPQTQGDLMVVNIWPKRYIEVTNNKVSRDAPVPSKQASILYEPGKNYWSVNSAAKGMDKKVQEVLGSSNNIADATINALQSVGSIATDAGQSVINGINSIGAGIKSALLTGQNCSPPAYTQQDRIIYPGCLSKSSNPIFGNSLGSGPSAPAINAIGTAVNRATGNSEPYSGELKPGGFVNPMKKGYTFTSKFGWRGKRMHNGVDLAAPMGTPIYASADGVVARMHNSCPATAQDGCGTSGFSGYGNIVYLKHQGAYTLYAHLSSVLVNQGETVKQGQLIGEVGDSGSSRGKHLHFETRLSNEVAVNPEQFIKF